MVELDQTPFLVRMILQRLSPNPVRTMGEMTINGSFAAWTLERPLIQYPSDYHAIPAGIFPISIVQSLRFGRLMPLLAVPGHSGIEIHWGNYVTNSHGCILVGTMRDDNMLYNTREKFDELFPIIQAAVATEGCDIEVRDAPSATE